MSIRIVLVGFGERPSDAAEGTILGVLQRNGVDYGVVTLSYSSERVRPRKLATGKLLSSDLAAYKHVDLPTIDQITVKWEDILRDLSAALPEVLVSLYVPNLKTTKIGIGGSVL